MKTFLTLSFAFIFVVSLQAQTTQSTYSGNGNGGFGSTIGGGSLLVSNNASGDLSFTLTKGAGALNDVFVLYFDSISGGFNNTGSFNDQADLLRRGISGASGGSTGINAINRSLLNFNTGFTADYALAFNTGFAGLWQLANGGDNSLLFRTAANLSPTGNANSATYSFNINVTDLGLSANSGQTFKFIGTYLNADSSFRSNEFLGVNAGSTNPGTGTVTATSELSFQTIPEPSSASLMALGAAGLLALRRRRNA